MNNITKSGSALYKDKSKCCGCGGCAFVCPKNAIVMKFDDCGVIYPPIDLEKCIGCNICVAFCSFGKNRNDAALVSYAASNVDGKQKFKSSSAGIFPALATYFLRNGGAVVGVSLKMINGKADVRHVMVIDENELPTLQGSKYVQSAGLDNYREVLEFLKTGKKILFSGTPCQISCFKSLFKKYSDQIYTVDIICHGVPGLEFFNDYILSVENKKNCEITDFIFRDKKNGWGLQGNISYIVKNKKANKSISPESSSYYRFFLDGETYRDSCYSCPYTCLQRSGDLTIGDYWGAQKFSPELMVENGGMFNSREGVSCILCNSQKGKMMLDCVKYSLISAEVDVEKILIINKQLREPATHTGLRDKIFKEYKSNGYKGVERIYLKIRRKEKAKKFIKSLIPEPMLKRLKKKL